MSETETVSAGRIPATFSARLKRSIYLMELSAYAHEPNWDGPRMEPQATLFTWLWRIELWRLNDQGSLWKLVFRPRWLGRVFLLNDWGLFVTPDLASDTLLNAVTLKTLDAKLLRLTRRLLNACNKPR